MSNQPGSPKPRAAAVGFSVAAFAAFIAGATALMTQGCTESSTTKGPATNGAPTSSAAATMTTATTPPPPPPPTDKVPPPT